MLFKSILLKSINYYKFTFILIQDFILFLLPFVELFLNKYVKMMDSNFFKTIKSHLHLFLHHSQLNADLKSNDFNLILNS